MTAQLPPDNNIGKFNPLGLLLSQEVGGAPEQPELGFHQGIITAWDQAAGTNTIFIAGSNIPDVPVLSAGAVMIGSGDVVGILRVRTQYFILGRISNIANALTIRSASVLDGSYTVSGATYGDLNTTYGPELTDVYIGPSRRCLVFISAFMGATDEGYVACHFDVTGASTIPPPSGPGAFAYGLACGSTVAALGGDPTMVTVSASRMFLLTEADGLNEGFNTFTMKYMGVNDLGGVPTNNDCVVENRVITVMPF